MNKGPHQGQPVAAAGKPIAEAKAIMILVHGRGASAYNILELGNDLFHPDFAYVAPQAAGNTWYPYSFLAPIAQNEPGISSGLEAIGTLVAEAEAAGVSADKIVIAGFSQGACLASEFVARQGRPFGGLLAFSGGVIGPPGSLQNYEGALEGMPIFLGCSDIDPHIPLQRVHETAVIFEQMGATVNKQIYPNMGHTIIQDEIDQAQKIVAGILSQENL